MFYAHYKISDKRFKFGDKEISKSNFHNNIKLFEINNIDVNKKKVSQKNVYNKKNNSYKYFIGYDDNDVIRPIFIALPKIIGYVKYFELYKKSLLKLIIECLLGSMIKNC